MRILNNRAIFFVITFLVSLLFTKYYFLFTHEHYEPASTERMSEFAADKVFQKRVLPILLANFTINLTGLSLDHVIKVFCLLSCIALLYGFRDLLDESSPNAPAGLAFLVIVPVGWNYIALNGIYHTYDIPALAFFCWGLVLFLRKRFVLFYAIYILAGLNRESTCFITIAIFSLGLRIPEPKNFMHVFIQSLFKTNKHLLLHCVIQMLLWFSNKFGLEYFFRNSPGNYYENTLSMTIFIKDALNGNPSWPYLDTSSFFGHPLCFFTIFAGLWLILPFLWKHIPSSSKKLFWVVPPYLLAAFLHANLMETRVYHEINVILALAITSGLHCRSKSKDFH